MVVPNLEEMSFLKKNFMLKDLHSNIHKSLSIDCHIIITTIASILSVYYVPDMLFITLQELIIYSVCRESIVCITLKNEFMFY